jgi:penicillin-binding protein 1A
MDWKSLLRRVRARLTWKRVFAGAVLSFGALALFVIGLFIYAMVDLPSIDSLDDYNPMRATKLYSDDGFLVADFSTERRTVAPVEVIPEHVKHAFLAAEDARFYEHEGLDYWGILRAALKNLRPGAHLQGASTLTQQTVKTMIVGSERNYMRKLKEALLTRDLEQMLSKDEILHLYLNQIYFGSGAYGIEEAAQVYFGKSVRDVTLGEAAYLACIPKSPNRYTIIADPAAAKDRQKYVLSQMLANGWAEEKAVAEAIAAPVPRPAGTSPYLRKTPHYVEQVRRYLVETYGEERVYQGGLTVYLGMSAAAQVAGQDALRQGLEDLARVQGWPGARLRIEVNHYENMLKAIRSELDELVAKRVVYEGLPAPKVRERWVWDLSLASDKSIIDDAAMRRAVELVRRQEYQRVTGVVTIVDSVARELWIDLGTAWGKVSMKDIPWARRFSPHAATPPPRDPSEVAARGDLVEVEIAGDKPTGSRDGRPVLPVTLIPRPKAQAALVAIDPNTRYVRALVGGYEANAGLLRATQSKRQPGSAFKPIVYATGLAQKAITPASICPDSPVVHRDPWTGKAWKPDNYEDGKYDGNITFRIALTKSKNTCSVKLIEKLGPAAVIETARALGIESDLPENLTLALGTGDVAPIELANAYATIAAGGMRGKPIFIRKIVDYTGTVLEEHQVELTPAMDPTVAFVVTQMMRSVIQEGTATKAQVLERPLAGKTGTSNESRNVWFSGFAPQLVGTVWVGFDDNSPLGGRATGGGTALPIWIRFMGRALTGVPAAEFAPPEEGVVSVKVDRLTGLPSKAEDALDEWFLDGTEPKESTRPLDSPFLVDDDNSGPVAKP